MFAILLERKLSLRRADHDEREDYKDHKDNVQHKIAHQNWMCKGTEYTAVNRVLQR
jgi:hypothetical protein